MCYQIKKLLETSHRRQRLNPPSLTLVSLQGAAAYLLPAIVYAGIFLFRAPNSVILVATAGNFWIPVLYILVVAFLIWWREYIPPINGPSASARAARALAFYFYRVLGTYFILYIPGCVLGRYPQCTSITGLVVSINPIGTFCVIIKKSDVKRYIMELVTLPYVFSDCDCKCNFDCNWIGRKYEVGERDTPARISASILGFDITEDEEDSNSPNEDAVDDTGSDVESMDAESGADVVGLVETKDLESGKHSCASRLPARERPMAVLMTGETVSADALRDETTRTTDSGWSDVPTIARDGDTNQ